MRFFFSNLVDAAGTVITASSENTKLPARNVANGLAQKVWRTSSTAGAEWIAFDLGSAQEVASLVIFAHTLKATDTLLKIEASSVADFSVIDFASPLAWDAGAILAVFEKRVARYWRIGFTKSAAETRDVGRIFLGDYWAPASFVDHTGVDEGVEDLSVTQQGPSGQEFTDIRPRFATVSVDFIHCTEADAIQFKAISQSCGEFLPLFIQIETDPYAEKLTSVRYVRFRRAFKRAVTGFDSTLLWDVKLEFKEVL